MVMPASTVTVEAARSTAINRLSRLMSTMAPVVTDVAVKLCPLPSAFTVVRSLAARDTIVDSSSSFAGR